MAAAKKVVEAISIKPPNIQRMDVPIVGLSPYVQNAFSEKARQKMRDQQAAGSTAKGKKVREPKDFQAIYEGAQHIAVDENGTAWRGLPANGIRAALISACRLVGFQMTKAKLSVFIEADGYDKTDGTPLVRITKGEPQYCEHPVRNETGVVDIRPRAMWLPGWQATVRVAWDGDQFTSGDVANLLSRAGQQVGIGEGRPDSPNSCGMGWGMFAPVQ